MNEQLSVANEFSSTESMYLGHKLRSCPELFCSGYGYRPRYNAENDNRKRSHLKTLSIVERLENDAFWKRCFLVWTEKTTLSENGDDIKIDTPGRQTTRP